MAYITNNSPRALRRCARCGRRKLYAAFYRLRNRGGRGRVSSACKPCERSRKQSERENGVPRKGLQ